MSDKTWPWPFVDFLIECFDLNECEAADLSDRAQRLLDTGMGLDAYSKTNLIEALWMRADVLVNAGSPLQLTWNSVKQAAAMNKLLP